MLEGFLENGRNICLVDVSFDKDWAANKAASHDFSSIFGDGERYNYVNQLGYKLQDLILDRTVAVAERVAKAAVHGDEELNAELPSAAEP